MPKLAVENVFGRFPHGERIDNSQGIEDEKEEGMNPVAGRFENPFGFPYAPPQVEEVKKVCEFDM